MKGRLFQPETKESTKINTKNNKPKKDLNCKIKKGNRITMQHPSLVNVDPPKHKDTEMRISISKKQSWNQGHSTQVKIVIPSTLPTPTLRSEIDAQSFSPCSSSKSLEEIQERNTYKYKSKRTARKSISSFSPRVPVQSSHDEEPQPVVCEGSSKKDSHNYDFKKRLKPTMIKFATNKISNSNDPSPSVHKEEASNVIKESEPTSKCSFASNDTVKNRTDSGGNRVGPTAVKEQEHSIEFQMKLFESEWKKYLNADEREKVQKKLERRVALISDKNRLSRQLHKFMLMKTSRLMKDPKKVFLVIKEVIDELSKYAQKNVKPAISTTTYKKVTDTSTPWSSETEVGSQFTKNNGLSNAQIEQEKDCKKDLESVTNNGDQTSRAQMNKRKRHILKLEQALHACGKQIKKIEEEGLSLSDMENEDSSYLRVSRYKARYMKIYNKIAQLRNLDNSLERRVDKKFKTEASRIPDINNEIEKLVNRKKVFPDYADILKLYQRYYQENNLVVEKEIVRSEGK